MSDSASCIVEVARVQTLADRGLRFTFDAPETEVLTAAQLMEYRRLGVAGKLTFEPVEQADTGNAKDGHELATRSKRKSKGASTQGAGPHRHIAAVRGPDLGG